VAAAFVLSAPDNDSSMLTNLPTSSRCRTCGRSLDPEWIDPLFLVAAREWDVGYTYDGYCIVSQTFRDALRERGARYIALPSEPSFFVLVPTERIPFDAARRRTAFDNLCADCGRYHDIAGARPVFLKSEPPPDELRGTDVEFGSGDEQHPLLVLGARLAEELHGAGLRGLQLRQASD
jgi:hypothetical protein